MVCRPAEIIYFRRRLKSTVFRLATDRGYCNLELGQPSGDLDSRCKSLSCSGLPCEGHGSFQGPLRIKIFQVTRMGVLLQQKGFCFDSTTDLCPDATKHALSLYSRDRAEL